MSNSNYYKDLVKRIREIQQAEIPGSLLSEQPVRTGGEFDPNIYFNVLTHLSLRPGYVLDFAYSFHDGLGGHPCLYARPRENTPFTTIDQQAAWEKKHRLCDYLVADGSPESFFELVVFREVANQFYLYWHAAYNDLRIVTDREEIENTITTLNELGQARFDPAEAKVAKALNPEPRIELTETSASVIFCTFTQWGGFTLQQEVFSLVPPHLLLCADVLQTARYNCGHTY